MKKKPLISLFLMLLYTFHCYAVTSKDVNAWMNMLKPTVLIQYGNGSSVDNKLTTKNVQVGHEILSIKESGFLIKLKMTLNEDYVTFKMDTFTAPVGKEVLRVFIKGGLSSNVRAIPLSYMVQIDSRMDNCNIDFPYLYSVKSKKNPIGSFAMYAYNSIEESDHALLQIWANEGLPHPKVEGEWTYEKAKKWLADWQDRFKDQSTFIVGANNKEELYSITEKAIAMKMRKVYLHTSTWRGEYWPNKNSFLHLKKEVFPEGEKDLKAYADYLADNGLSIALHTVSCSIGGEDPDYMRNEVHPHIATWGRGVLAKPVSMKDRVIYVKPNPGEKYQQVTGRGWHKPGFTKQWIRNKTIVVGGEIIHFSNLEETSDGLWKLNGCYRSSYNTERKAHKEGLAVRGLYQPYGQCFVADADSPLLDEVAKRYADFCNTNNIDHLECDGQEIYQARPWGTEKFSWKVYENIDHPCTSNTSNGSPLRYHMEYWFHSSIIAKKNHTSGGVAGGDGVPLLLYHDDRPASGPYEIHMKPTQRTGVGGRTVNVIRPLAMFGIGAEILEGHGLVPYVFDQVKQWRELMPDVPDQLREAIKLDYEADHPSPHLKHYSQKRTNKLYRPVAGEKALEPFAVMPSEYGMTTWFWGQEFGPVVPREYIESNGKPLTLKAQFDQQTPEMLVRVLPVLKEMDKGDKEESVNVEKGDHLLEAYHVGAGQTSTAHPLSLGYHIWSKHQFINGEVKTGKEVFFKSFEIENPKKIKVANFLIQVDDHAKVYLNNRQIFEGGAYNKLLVTSVMDYLKKGKNDITIRAENFGGPGSLAAAIQIGDENGMQTIVTDKTWLSGGHRKESVEIAMYGQAEWPKVSPTPVVVDPLIMPKFNKDIFSTEDQKLSLDKDVLTLESKNNLNSMELERKNFPGWKIMTSMSGKRSLAFEVFGDNSGAVLMIQIKGRGMREFVCPINFVGRKEVVIPTGLAAFSSKYAGLGDGTFHLHYSNIHEVKMGFSQIPGKTYAKVEVRNLRFMKESDEKLKNPVFKLNEGSLSITGEIPVESYLWYKGGDKISVYDRNWRPLFDLPVVKKSFQTKKGFNSFSIQSSAYENRKIWLETQLIEKGKAISF